MRPSRPFLAALLLAASPAAAVETGDAEMGRRIANRWCAECHDVTGTMPRLSDGPPSFLSIARRSETTAAGLRAFLHTPHGAMPDLSLTRAEIDDLVAYLLGLKQR